MPTTASTPKRDRLPEAETWNLDDLFADEAAFERLKERTKAQIQGIDGYRGRLGESPEILAEALDAVADLEKTLSRLYTFAMLASDTDTRVPRAQARRQELEMLWTQFQGVSSFVSPEILALPDEQLRDWLAAPGLAAHRHPLEDLLRTREHVRSPAEEKIIAEAGLITGAAHSVFGMLNDAELPRAEVTLADGTEVKLTPAAFMRHRTTAVREDRELLYRSHFGAYAGFRETFGQMLFQALKRDVFRSRVRGYPSCLAAALDPENIPEAVYRNLIEQIRDGLPVLHRYLALRRKAFDLEQLEYHDMAPPLIEGAEPGFAVAEARAAVQRSLAPLGPDYGAALGAAFDDRWIDWHPTDGKRSGAYATGSAYDVHPYVLLNYNGDYDGVSTLAHELGHAMHSYFSNRTQPYPTSSYSIFVAEVASTFNEALLNRWMIRRAASREERIALIGRYLDGLRGTLFRQTMFAEFELAIHEQTERGEPLTGEAFSERYLELLRDHMGHRTSVVHVDERYAVEWACVPHFYYNFYVYQYATGIVAATALARAVGDGDAGALARYMKFLSSGGSDYSLNLLREAGVDLETPAPYRATLDEMTDMIDTLEQLLDEAQPA